MNKICLLVLIFFSIAAKAQNLERAFFNKKGEKSTLKDAYTYQLVRSANDVKATGYINGDKDTVVTVYFVRNDKPGVIKRYDSKGKLNGRYQHYYENGNVKEVGVYRDHKASGKITRYYPDGRLQEVIEFVDQNSQGIRTPYNFFILNYWDSTGMQTVKDGNGICKRYFFESADSSHFNSEYGLLVNGLRDLEWTGYNGDTLSYKEKFSKGDFLEGVRLDQGKQISYKQVEVQPEYPGGLEMMNRFLNHHLQYPKDARRSRIEGKVFVQFVVNKDGSIIDVKVIKGVDRSIDEEAIRVVSIMPRWSQGVQRGKIVKARFILPVWFKLDR